MSLAQYHGELANRTPEQMLQWFTAVQQMLRDGLEAGVDYGHIPKVEKPILFKPGAEKLALLADLEVRVERVGWEPGPFGDMGATYKGIARRPSGSVIETERYAGYDEHQFMVVSSNGELKYKAPWDTVIFMAQKRAYVGVVKLALGLSGLFADPGKGQVEPDEAAARKSARSGGPVTAGSQAGAPDNWGDRPPIPAPAAGPEPEAPRPTRSPARDQTDETPEERRARIVAAARAKSAAAEPDPGRPFDE
jgi:hypothetical protein